MIDIHMHTTYSDGADSLIEVLKKAEQLKLEYISITDHDNCNAYKELAQIDIKKYFTGKIIPGIEFKGVNDNGRLMELLGYYINPYKMQKWCDEYYKDKSKEKLQQKYFDILYDKATNMGLVLSKKEDLNFDGKKQWASLAMYNEIKAHEENYEKLPADLMESFDTFSKKYCADKNFDLYIDKTKDYPTIKEISDIIKKCGGLIFMPHVYIYPWIEDMDKHILRFKNEYGINGVECFHSTFNEEKINYLLQFCKKNNLFVSGGSDYHGVNKKNVEMAVGKGNLHIEVKNIMPWVSMMEDYLNSKSANVQGKVMAEAIQVLNQYEETKDASLKEKYLLLIKDKEKIQKLDYLTMMKYM